MKFTTKLIGNVDKAAEPARAAVETWHEEPRDASALWLAGAGLVLAIAVTLLRGLVLF